MHLSPQLLLLSLPLLPLVSSGLIQMPNSNRVDSAVNFIEIPGLVDLSKYVCPQTLTRHVHRRAIPTRAQLEKDKLQALLEKIQEVERQMSDFLNGLGIGKDTTPTTMNVDAGSTATIPELPGESVAAGDTTIPTPSLTQNEASISPSNQEPDTTTTRSSNLTTGVERPNVLPLPITNTTTSNSTANYKFNPQSSKNVAVYYGQTPLSSSTSLTSQCASPDIDIIILAFIISRTSGSSPYPTLNLAGACTEQTLEMVAKASGLLSCPKLAEEIKTCQGVYGKKVLMSIGGATSGVYFGGADQARDLGDKLWEVFGPPGKIEDGLRPFGSVVLDGFDFDNENNLPGSYEIVASTLRSHFNNFTSSLSTRDLSTSTSSPASTKQFYLSSAPQCPFPDASNPLPLILQCDFVFVQFYNNPPCEIGSSGFGASVKQWSEALAKSPRDVKPRLYIGAPGWAAAGSSAYAGIGGPKGMGKVVEKVGGIGVGKEALGGVMFWDGPESIVNTEGGKSILGWAKEGLNALGS